MFTKSSRKPLGLLAAAASLTLVATACAESDRDASDGGEQPFVFASAGDIASLDPFLATDGETFRYSRQVFDTLLQHESGGSEIVGGLAETWDQSEDGTVWTFGLRDGVEFHDGDELNAEAVCANFDRWFNLTGAYQSSNNSYYWQKIFGGFAENEEDHAPPEPRFASCDAEDELTVVIEVSEYSSLYPGGFSLAAFGIMSPSSLEAMEGQEIGGEEGNPTLPEYSQVPGTVAGTGPFTVEEWNQDQGEITLNRFDGYWGDPAGFETMIIRAIPDENARRQALEAGDIHGYDLVAPADVAPLQEAGFEVPTRDVFNVLYLAYQQDHEALADLEVREALSHAVNRQRIVDTILPEGGEVATQFHPDTLDGWSEDVREFEYDPDLAREALADAGYGEGELEVEFCYPTEVTRPYMPAPKDIFDVITEDLQEVGVTVEATSYEWAEYLNQTDSGNCPLYLLGWTGDYNDAYNFIGTWFAGPSSAWGLDDQELFDRMAEVSSNPDAEERVVGYQELNEMVMDVLPGLPISSSPPSIAFSGDVNPPNVSPLTQENFAEASWK
ncbi:ABC transporter substrate-binding protein [Nocardiopsis terrae]|uniref:Peptide/nickel transport system substrate-binding protein n=1 Tax=Nocardiopsis terrae TaxID=372655 RepID=A0ABR9HCF3_9ACTN|nr:ABC transporter substrate-binding protein [Nocardiopsis terrae]MBE1456713.1 peptide/nickel transport system substrate-binding protein [Nocardiopsis terrae]GHC75441.1 ABC transporter substrate-binding protein [Nocardiopsis terrae]